MSYAYIHICKDINIAEAKKQEHQAKGRQTSLDEHDGVDIIDNRASANGPILISEESTVYIVKAW